jgi:hypothetical protein
MVCSFHESTVTEFQLQFLPSLNADNSRRRRWWWYYRGRMLRFITVLCAIAVLLRSIASPSVLSIHELMQWSTKSATVTFLKQWPTASTTTHNSLNDAERLGVYRPIVANYSNFKKLPVPLQVVEQYKQWHSVDNLLRNDAAGRNYAIAFYQCPLQAGNRIHHFLNAFLWAILTNRTMLWKYYDQESCLQYGTNYSKDICVASNTAEDCSETLLRAPWIPSYDEWAPKLNLEEPYEFPFRSTHPKSIPSRWYSPWKDGDEKFYGADNATKYPHQVAVFVQNVWKFRPFQNPQHRRDMLDTLRARECADNLYALGVDFLFGMLQRSAFDFSKHIRASQGTLDNKKAMSVTVHSRHIFETTTGCNISKEAKCMRSFIRNVRGRRINVRLMSDRACTIARMKQWLGKRNISVAVAKHDESKDYLAEHGPFAGAGFYQDLALASTARSAIAAMRRSSSDLMIELVVFNRKMDAWRAGEDYKIANVDLCIMDKEVDPNKVS